MRKIHRMRALPLAVWAAIGAVASQPALADCSEIVTLPMEPHAIVPTDGGGFFCEWRTQRWSPKETCGVFGFEAAGPGTMPASLVFKRSNTMYETEWEPRSNSDGWTTATLGPETREHRCFAGWCDPVSYILRTAAPVDEAVCAEELELRIRMEDRAE